MFIACSPAAKIAQNFFSEHTDLAAAESEKNNWIRMWQVAEKVGLIKEDKWTEKYTYHDSMDCEESEDNTAYFEHSREYILVGKRLITRGTCEL